MLRTLLSSRSLESLPFVRRVDDDAPPAAAHARRSARRGTINSSSQTLVTYGTLNKLVDDVRNVHAPEWNVSSQCQREESMLSLLGFVCVCLFSPLICAMSPRFLIARECCEFADHWILTETCCLVAGFCDAFASVLRYATTRRRAAAGLGGGIGSWRRRWPAPAPAALAARLSL